MLSGPVGYLLGSKGGAPGGEVAQTEEQFVKGYTKLHGSFERLELNVKTKTLFVTMKSNPFSPEAKKGHLVIHYNIPSSSTGEHWKYWYINKTMDLDTNSHHWTVGNIPDSEFDATKYYLCIKCYETKEMINDVRLDRTN